MSLRSADLLGTDTDYQMLTFSFHPNSGSRANGAAFTTLHSFSGTNGEGVGLMGDVILLDNVLYGTTTGGGDWGSGTVFSISLPITPPQLSILAAGPNVVLS